MTKSYQQLLLLYSSDSTPEGNVVAWSIYDGTSGSEKIQSNDDGTPPYESVLAAMKDGWRVIQFPTLLPPQVGEEYSTHYLKFEFVLEKLIEEDS